MPAEPMLLHHVYFTLREHSEAARRQLLDACRELLTGHEGEVFYAAGTLAEEIAWSISDRDFDVALCILFRDKAAHDRYQDSQRHERFLAENQERWSQVRAFDISVPG